jgi:hypothetical protein
MGGGTSKTVQIKSSEAKTSPTKKSSTDIITMENKCVGLEAHYLFSGKYYIYHEKTGYVDIASEHLDIKSAKDELHKYFVLCEHGKIIIIKRNGIKRYYYKIRLEKKINDVRCSLVEFNENTSNKSIVLILDKCLEPDSCDKIIKNIRDQKDKLEIDINFFDKHITFGLNEILDAKNHSDFNEILLQHLYDRSAIRLRGGNNDEYLDKNDDVYFNKYLKYKNKYLSLKNQ